MALLTECEHLCDGQGQHVGRRHRGRQQRRGQQHPLQLLVHEEHGPCTTTTTTVTGAGKGANLVPGESSLSAPSACDVMSSSCSSPLVCAARLSRLVKRRRRKRDRSVRTCCTVKLHHQHQHRLSVRPVTSPLDTLAAVAVPFVGLLVLVGVVVEVLLSSHPLSLSCRPRVLASRSHAPPVEEVSCRAPPCCLSPGTARPLWLSRVAMARAASADVKVSDSCHHRHTHTRQPMGTTFTPTRFSPITVVAGWLLCGYLSVVGAGQQLGHEVLLQALPHHLHSDSREPSGSSGE